MNRNNPPQKGVPKQVDQEKKDKDKSSLSDEVDNLPSEQTIETDGKKVVLNVQVRKFSDPDWGYGTEKTFIRPTPNNNSNVENKDSNANNSNDNTSQTPRKK